MVVPDIGFEIRREPALIERYRNAHDTFSHWVRMRYGSSKSGALCEFAQPICRQQPIARRWAQVSCEPTTPDFRIAGYPGSNPAAVL